MQGARREERKLEWDDDGAKDALDLLSSLSINPISTKTTEDTNANYEMSGFLLKLGEKGILKGWKNRYFVIKKGERYMEYYKNKDDKTSVGKIDLSSVMAVRELDKTHSKDKFGFEIVTPTRTYVLMATNEKLVDQWINAVKKAASSLQDGSFLSDDVNELGALLDAKGQLPSYGQLFVNIKECSGLELNKDNGILGVYCMLSLEKQSVKTHVLTDFSSLVWNEGFFFDITQLDQVIQHRKAQLIITVWATDISKFGGEHMGQITIPIVALFHGKPIDQTFKLSPAPTSLNNPNARSKSVRATLHIKLHFTTIHHKVGLSDFDLLKVVGKGNFGKVMQVRKKDTGRIYAMKVLRKETVLAADAVQHTLSETSVLRRISHPFIVNLKYAFQTSDKLYMILDYLSGGELFYHLSNVDRFSEDRARFYAAEIVSALGYLHSINVVYRDLKPENLLLDISGHVCLTDFGLVKEGLRFGEVTHTFCGSPEYLAPEILQGKGYGREVDWWALGTFLYEMLEGLPPFYDEDIHIMNAKILGAPLEFDVNHFSPEAKSLLRGLLQRDPKLRLGSGPRDHLEIREHPFFRSIDWVKLESREIEPTFKPHLQSAEDVRYFDPEFTTQTPKDSYVEGPMLSENKQRLFDGFSYVSTNAFEQLMKQRRKLNVNKTNANDQ